MNKIILYITLFMTFGILHAQNISCTELKQQAKSLTDANSHRAPFVLVFMARNNCPMQSAVEYEDFQNLMVRINSGLTDVDRAQLKKYLDGQLSKNPKWKGKVTDSKDLYTGAPELTEVETEVVTDNKPNKIASSNNSPSKADVINGEYKSKKVDRVPVYPGCENIRESQKLVCFSTAIDEIIKQEESQIKKANKKKQSGKVNIRITVDPSGSADVAVVDGLDSNVDNAIKNVIKKGLKKLSPAVSNGKPIEISILKPITVKAD